MSDKLPEKEMNELVKDIKTRRENNRLKFKKLSKNVKSQEIYYKLFGDKE